MAPDQSSSEISAGADPRERFRIFVLCPCPTCKGTGKKDHPTAGSYPPRCDECRGEGRVRSEIASCASPEALGMAIVVLGQEGEFADCPIGILDTEGEVGKKWLVRPWQPSAREVAEAGRVLAKSRWS